MQTARDKIRELRALLDDGLLSEQEFDSRKNAILDAEYAPPGRALASLAPGEVGEAGGMPNGTQVRQGTELGLMAGMEIGPQNRRYRLERLIAQGGMGQVWEATDLATHAELGHSACVALKILPPQLTMSTTHARLLIEEATQARRLAHEHIVRVYEWARDPATMSYFIIMECLDGEDLDSLLAREGPMALARATQLLAPVASALQYAWDKHRLVHRDIKPANVFVTTKGEVKLLDFGIAARERASTDSAASVGLEAPANSGTAGYRAPEAGARHSEPARALDVYAVAVMIYQMVEGRMPFDGARTAAHQPARPGALAERQWEVLQSGFAWEARARPGSVAELLDKLDKLDIAAGPPQEEIRQRQQRQQAERQANAQAAAAAAAAAAATATAAAAQQVRARERREKEKAECAIVDAARGERKDALRRQLLERRAIDAELNRLAKAEQERAALQARAAAAYRAEQLRARAELAARSRFELAAPMPTPSFATGVADKQGVLRDAFAGSGGLGPELVLIPTGRFQMGSPEHERRKSMEAGAQQAWLERETPQHWVGIEQSFALGRYPVTVAQWRQFAQATGWRRQGDFNPAAPGFAQADDHPAVGVSWNDAQQFLGWLSVMTGQVYRLPSEAEWEYACRAGTRTAFSFGDTISAQLANYDAGYSYNGSPLGACRQGTSRVGEFAPNPWGLYDMHGNVWEWTQDVVHDNYEGAPNTGRAWEEQAGEPAGEPAGEQAGEQAGEPPRRVLRGGAWQYNPRYLRSAVRNGSAPGLCNAIIGFRVARKLA